MNAAGIVCEYNPFHAGHLHHIAETRRLTGCDAVVCVMSGNFVQRGALAVFSKTARAEAAVRCGADLVLELPLARALSSAEGFAAGAVTLLAATGVCRWLSYGSESGDAAGAQQVARALLTPEAEELVRADIGRGLSYAAARQRAAETLLGGAAQLLCSPNDLLGTEYVMALARLGAEIRPIPVRRTGAAHDGVMCDGMPSASSVRAQLLAGETALAGVPEPAAEIFRAELAAGRGPVRPEALEQALLARLRTMTDADYAALPVGTDGLADRLKRAGRTQPSVQAVLDSAKTKRYPMSRLRRVLYYALFGITAQELIQCPPYLRVLALNRTGRAVLAQMRRCAALPVIVKPAAGRMLGGAAAAMLKREAMADDLYALCMPEPGQRAGGTFWRQSPLFIE